MGRLANGQNLGVSTAVRTRLSIQVSTQGKDVEPAVEVDMVAGAQVGVLLTALASEEDVRKEGERPFNRPIVR